MDDGVQLYLASTSPRRRELLAQLGLRFQILEPFVSEERKKNEAPEVFTLRMALEKARAGRKAVPATPLPVLGADTAVVVDGEVLGKPRDRLEALGMLRRLSGRSHQVYSAVAAVGGHEASRLSVTTVTFRVLAEKEVQWYWGTGEPADKAGGYAVQGLAAMFIPRLEGSYSGVMGLPLFETAELLREFEVGLQAAGGWSKI